MCGRYTLVTGLEGLIERYGVENVEMEIKPRYNIAPSQIVPVLVQGNRERKIFPFRWGLIPSFSQNTKSGYKMINARAETLLEKPSFKNLLLRRRCLIPSDSLFEWKRNKNEKQPYRIMLNSGEIFSFAGLYDIWKNPISGEKVYSCTIITTKANDLIAGIHDRMPVILDRSTEELWLNREEQNPSVIQDLLISFDSVHMKVYPVHTMVGNVKNDVPECIIPIG